MNEYNSDDSDDSDDYDSDFSDSDDAGNDLIIYNSDEISNTRFNVVLCELFNKKLHGANNMKGIHYLTIVKIKSVYNFEGMMELSKYFNRIYKKNGVKILPHLYIKNYENIIKTENYIKPEIAECVFLPSGHSVCIKKTIWIKLIQRKWKRVFEERQRVVKMRTQYASVKEREITGLWPKSCRFYPGIYGLMNHML
jgi:hypothetical protein